MKKIIMIVIGCISLGLGAVGAILPILPSVPFLLLAVFCFTKSSERLHRWFTGTRLYKNNLESYVAGKGMTRKTKFRIVGVVTLLMAVGFSMMMAKGIYVPCVILAIVWMGHIFYFGFRVKTLKEAVA